MKKIILLIWMIFLFTSCYSNPEDKKIENNKIIFENNIKCNAFFNRYNRITSIDMVWIRYSIKINSCIDLYSSWHEGIHSYIITNIFTWESLYNCNEKENGNCKSDAYNKFKDL